MLPLSGLPARGELSGAPREGSWLALMTGIPGEQLSVGAAAAASQPPVFPAGLAGGPRNNGPAPLQPEAPFEGASAAGARPPVFRAGPAALPEGGATSARPQTFATAQNSSGSLRSCAVKHGIVPTVAISSKGRGTGSLLFLGSWWLSPLVSADRLPSLAGRASEKITSSLVVKHACTFMSLDRNVFSRSKSSLKKNDKWNQGSKVHNAVEIHTDSLYSICFTVDTIRQIDLLSITFR